jgi:TRAP transporter TAXI family solute receptor
MAKKKQKMLLVGIGVIILSLIASVSFVTPTNAKAPKFITISSYPIGSLGTILATGFSNAIEKKTGIRTRPTPADTDVGRVLPVKKGQAQVAILTAATVYFVSNGKGEFGAKEWGPQRIRLVFAGNIIHHGMALRANSGIKTWADLKGKKVAYPPGLFSMTVPAFIAYGGLSMDDVVVLRAAGYIAGVKMTMEGKADACHACPVTPLTKEWEAAPYGLRYLPMDPGDKAAWDRMRKFAPFMASPIWADYGGLGEGGPKWLAYYPYTLTSYDTVDEESIYTIVKGMVDGYDLYKDVKKPSSGQWTLKDTLNLGKPVYIPFHPGLIRYAKEKGEWTAEHEAWQAKALREENSRIKLWKPTK